MSFEKLKSQRGASTRAQILDKLKSLDGQNNQRDEENTYWNPTRDKSGNGFAIIRFLPAPEGEDDVFVRTFDHGFKGPTGKWYIENSLTTLGQPDPVGEYNSKLWNSGVESDKEIARVQKRRLRYHANILVISDPANRENEGKVFRFKFGKKIFSMIENAMAPRFEDEVPINPFDMWEGANFRLKIRTVDEYPNYDASKFDDPSPISNDEDRLREIYGQIHSLKALLDPSKYKSYDELKRKLDEVIGFDTARGPTTKTRFADEFPVERSEPPAFKPKSAPQPALREDPAPQSSADDDDDLEFFSKLVDD